MICRQRLFDVLGPISVLELCQTFLFRWTTTNSVTLGFASLLSCELNPEAVKLTILFLEIDFATKQKNENFGNLVVKSLTGL